VRGPESEIKKVRDALGTEQARGVEVRFADLPSGPVATPKATDVESRLAAARKAYALPDVPACLAELGGDALVPDLLTAGRRPEAARVLFWRVACHVAGGSLPDAQRVAEDFSAYELNTPPEVEAASPEAEAVLGRALAQTSARPAARLSITSTPPGARVSIDGRESLCVTPCRIDLRPGPHVVALAQDGQSPERRSIVAPEGDTKVDVPMAAAPPELAARQWIERHGSGQDVDSAASLRLLAQAVRARSLALIAIDDKSPGARLRGVLMTSGDSRARAERVLGSLSEVPSVTVPLFDELLVEGKLVETTPLWKRPLFWGIVGAVAAIAAGVTYAVLYEPPVTTEVRF
jgi:hypothetical protein